MVTEQNEALTVVMLGTLPSALAAVAGPAVLPRIQTAPLTPLQDPIRRGEAGPRVAKLHAELFELGFLPKGNLPPYFGVSTDAAVRNLQRSCGHVPDGAVGPSTQKAIDEALARVREGTAARALTYTVRQGDSVLRISQALLGDAGRWREILAFNNLSDPNRIVPGMTLKIPPRH